MRFGLRSIEILGPYGEPSCVSASSARVWVIVLTGLRQGPVLVGWVLRKLSARPRPITHPQLSCCKYLQRVRLWQTRFLLIVSPDSLLLLPLLLLQKNDTMASYFVSPAVSPVRYWTFGRSVPGHGHSVS